LIPRSSLISGRIGEPSHSQPNPWKELSQLAPAGEQIAQFGGKKAVQIQQPIADQNGGSAGISRSAGGSGAAKARLDSQRTEPNPHETDLNPHGLVITRSDRSHGR
jgi:hypothetical protein